MFLQQKSTPDAQSLTLRLRENRLFSELSEDQIKKLVPAFRVKQFKDEDIICHCPDATHDAFILLDGKVAVKLMLGDLQYVIELQGAGAVFNAPGLLHVHSPYSIATALGTAVLIALDSDQIHTIISKDAQIGSAIFKTASRLIVEQYEKQLEHLLI